MSDQLEETLADVNSLDTPRRPSSDRVGSEPPPDLVAEVEMTFQFNERALVGLSAIEECKDIRTIYEARKANVDFCNKVGRAQLYTQSVIKLARDQGDDITADMLEKQLNSLESGIKRIKELIEIAAEYHELHDEVFVAIEAELQACLDEMYKITERRAEMVRNSPVKFKSLSDMPSPISPADPFTNYSPHMPLKSEEDAELNADLRNLRARTGPLKASVEFLPLQVDCYDSRAHGIFPESVSRLRDQAQFLSQTVANYVKDFHLLDEQLTNKLWDPIFERAVGPNDPTQATKIGRLARYGRAIGRPVNDIDSSPRSTSSEPSVMLWRLPQARTKSARNSLSSTTSDEQPSVTVMTAPPEIKPTPESSQLPKSTTADPQKRVSRPFVSRLRPPTDILSTRISTMSLDANNQPKDLSSGTQFDAVRKIPQFSQIIPPSPVPDNGSSNARRSIGHFQSTSNHTTEVLNGVKKARASLIALGSNDLNVPRRRTSNVSLRDAPQSRIPIYSENLRPNLVEKRIPPKGSVPIFQSPKTPQAQIRGLYYNESPSVRRISHQRLASVSEL